MSFVPFLLSYINNHSLATMTVNQGPRNESSIRVPDDRELPAIPRAHLNGNVESAINSIKAAYTNGTSHKSKYAIPLSQQLAFTPRKIRVITIGAGYSGLIVAQKFQHRYPEMQEMITHTIFEGRSQVGGTWLVNTYPGVQCDVPAQIYVSLIFWLLFLINSHFCRPSHLTQIQIGVTSTLLAPKFKNTSQRQ